MHAFSPKPRTRKAATFSSICLVLLIIKIDDKLTLTKHVSALCTEASKQLNAFTRISKFLSYDSKKLVINSFINSNFQYSPLVWHFVDMLTIIKLRKYGKDL